MYVYTSCMGEAQMNLEPCVGGLRRLVPIPSVQICKNKHAIPQICLSSHLEMAHLHLATFTQ